MPATQTGQAYRLDAGRWGLRFYDEAGRRRRVSPFPTKSAALKHYRDVIEPRLRGEPEPLPELTLAELVDVYLQRHAATRSGRTITTLRERLRHATSVYGAVPLHELERMSGDLADWQAGLPERYRYGLMQALRQALGAAVRWGYMTRNPAALAGPNPQPPPRTPDPFTLDEVDAIAAELGPVYGPLVRFAAATGLRPQEWAGLERRDVDRTARIVSVRRTVADGDVRDLAKTDASRRQVPLSARALAALDELPLQFGGLLFPSPRGELLDLDNWRRREWAPALEASGVRTRRIYDLRSTFVSHALAAGISVFELAKIAGTSVRMIEHHYGALLDGASAGIAGRLDAFEERTCSRNEGAQ
jgi:integrase